MSLAWLAVPLTAAFAVACGGYAISRGGPDELSDVMMPAEYARMVVAVCVAAVVEAAAEPGWLYAQANGLIGRRVVAVDCAVPARREEARPVEAHLPLAHVAVLEGGVAADLALERAVDLQDGRTVGQEAA